MTVNNWVNKIYDSLLSEHAKEKSEHFILVIAIASFLMHLILIYLIDLGVVEFGKESKLLKSPIAAIYTPFSFILLYEVYLLIYYLPKSFTNYITKQYEIITLIIIRRIFKDLANLQLSSDWFQIKDDLQFTYDLLASILLFFLLYWFYVLSRRSYLPKSNAVQLPDNIKRFINFKKIISVCLVPILFILATYTFLRWSAGYLFTSYEAAISFKNINNIFFDEFFTILIIVDVLLLLLSFFHTDEFHKVIRNSGFIISTILIRISFSVDGLVNTLLILAAVVFGLLILAIHNLYEKQIFGEEQ